MMVFEENRLDPRIIRTRKLLREAFIDLVGEKGYRNTTIQDITDRATLNRVTFYLHYDNKEDLLIHTTQALLQELVARIPPYQENASMKENILTELVIDFKFFAEYSDFMKAMLGKEGVWSFIYAWQDYHYQGSLIQLKQLNKYKPEQELETQIAIRHQLSAFTGVLQWWLLNDMPISAEELAQNLYAINSRGVYRRLGYDFTLEDELADKADLEPAA